MRMEEHSDVTSSTANYTASKWRDRVWCTNYEYIVQQYNILYIFCFYIMYCITLVATQKRVELVVRSQRGQSLS